MAGAASTARARDALPLLLAFASPWLIYAALLARQADDRFAGWRNDVVWPAEHFMTVQQDGLVTSILVYAMFGGIGGLILAWIVVGLVNLVGRAVGRQGAGARLFWPVWIAAWVWCFAAFKAVPSRVTVIDPAAKVLRVHEFGALSRLPAGTTEIRGDEIVAVDVSSYFYRRQGARYAELSVLTRDRRLFALARRTCASLEVEACLSSCDEDLVELARWLGRSAGSGPTPREGHHTLVLDRT